MVLSDYIRIKNTRGGFQRIHSRIYAELGNLTREHRCGVKEVESSGWSRVCQVVCRHIDRLNRGDRTVFSRCDPLLKRTHLRCESRLIAHGRGHAAKQSRHFRTGLSETENIVDKQQDILAAAILITELLRHGQTGQSYTQAGARRLVHLSEHKSGL